MHKYVVYNSEMDDIIEFDVASLVKNEIIRARQEAVKAWLREMYIREVAAIEEAVYGWLWFAAVLKDQQLSDLRRYLTNTTYRHLSKLIIAIDKIVRRCEEIDLEKLKHLARNHGLRWRDRSRCTTCNKYRESDYEILRDSFHIIQLLNKHYRENKCVRKKARGLDEPGTQS